MTRRLSGAISLFLTTVTGFVMVAYGSGAGIFGANPDNETPPSEIEAITTPAPSPTPQIVEQVVYRDEYIQVPATPPVAPEPNSALKAPVAAQHEEADAAAAPDSDGGEDYGEHEDD